MTEARKYAPSPDAIIRKLSLYGELPAKELRTLTAALSERVAGLGAREDLIREDDPSTDVNFILSGWACRYKMLENGRRQILSIMLPGDACDLNAYLMPSMDHSVCAITEIAYAPMPPSVYEGILRECPGIARALTIDNLVSNAIQREWTLNLGQRDAFARTAHLFCELYVRQRAIGMAVGQSCSLPMTQSDLGDATGVSDVHVNRTIQSLRNARLVTFTGKTLTIPDLAALQSAAMFNPNYLLLRI